MDLIENQLRALLKARRLFLLIFGLFSMSLSTYAVSPSPGSLFTYEGVLTDSSGVAITTAQTLTLQILQGTCVVYSETQSITPGASGEFSVTVGAGTRTDSTGNTADRIFASNGSVNCEGASAVTVSGFSSRSLHIKVGTTDLTPDVAIGNIPFAINAMKLADRSYTDFVNISTNITQTAVESWFASSVMGQLLSGTYTAPSATSAVNVTGTVAIANGGTGATTAAGARTNLGLAAIASSGSASDLTSGTVSTARLGSGTADATTYLRGDGTWAAVSGGGSVTSVAGKTGAVSLVASDISDFNTAADGRITLQKGAVSGIASLDASSRVPVAQLGSGTADTTKYLRGDGAWAAVSTVDATKLPLAGGAMTGNIDMGGNSVFNAGSLKLASNGYLLLGTMSVDPSGLTASDKGKVWFNSTSNQIKYWDGSATQIVGSGSGGITALTGDISASGAGSVTATISNGAITSAKVLDGTILKADMDFTGVNAGTSGITLVDSTGKFSTFACATVGQVPTWTVTGFACQAPAASLPSLTSAKIWVGDGTNNPQPVSLTGDANLDNAGNLSLVASGVVAGTYAKVTVDTKGRVTAGASLAASDIPSLDWSKIATGLPTTLSGYGITDAAKLGGQTGGQVLNGGTAAGENLTLEATSNATKGSVLLTPGGGKVGIGTTSPIDTLSIGVAPIASSTRALVNLSNTALSGASANGTYVSTNPAAFSGDFINFQVAGITKFKVDSTGKITGDGSGLTGIAGSISGLTAGRIALSSGASSVSDSANLQFNSTTGVTTLGGSSPGIASTGALTVQGASGNFTTIGNSGTTSSLILQSGSGGISLAGNTAISGANTFSTGTGAVSLNGPTTVAANQNFSMASGSGTFSQNYTGTGTASTITANALTSGSVLSLTSASTAAGTGQTGLAVSVTGTNGSASVTRYGVKSVVDSSGTSSTNVAGYFSALNGTNNYGLIVASGYVGIGSAAPKVQLDVAGAIRMAYDSTTCSSTIAGSLRYSGGVLELCNGTTWTALASGSSGISSLNGLTGTAQNFAIPGTSGLKPGWVSSGTDHTLNIPMANAAGVTAGLISKSEFDFFTSKLDSSYGFGGDVTGTANAITVQKIRGVNVSGTAPAVGQIFRYDGTNYSPSFASIADIKATISPFGGVFQNSACTSNQTLTYQSASDTFICQTIGNLDATMLTTGVLPVGRIPTSVVTQWSTVSTPANHIEYYGDVGIGGTPINFGYGRVLSIQGPGTGLQDGGFLELSSTNTSAGATAGRLVFTNKSQPGNEVIGYISTASDGGTPGNYGGKMTFTLKKDGVSGNSTVVTMLSNGNVGIGTTIPMATLDVNGHIGTTNALSPTVTCTSGSASVTGSDTRGTVTWSSGSISTCTVTFAQAYIGTPPVCVVSIKNVLGSQGIGSTTTLTTLKVDFAPNVASPNGFNYICLQ